ncbi:MAG TPA: glutathione S-transferase family protein [Gammaproteobacteria bacterium]
MTNPRYWSSQWYATKFSEDAWPGGWYWHDQDYNWFGPFESEHEASDVLKAHHVSERAASDERERKRAQFELYYHPLSTYSQKVLIAIDEKKARFTPQIVNLMEDEERERYRKIYPMGKIPLIALNHGPLIPESSIIIEYLDGLGGRRLISENPDVARKTRFKDRFLDLYLNESITTLVFQNRKPEAERDSAKIDAAQYRVKAVYDFMEYEVRDSTWANGENFSMSDCAAAAALFYADDVAPFDQYPSLAGYAQRLSERPSVKRVREEAKTYLT